MSADNQVPKLVKDRLIRIETRLVKYQEGNVLAIEELSTAIDDLAGAMHEIIDILTEESTNAQTQSTN
jgi:hypothetical protein